MELSPSQLDALAQHLAEWEQIGRATGPTDRPQAAAVLHDFYTRLGYEPPLMLYLASPALCWFAAAALQSPLGGAPQAPLGAQIRATLRDQFRREIQDELRAYPPFQLQALPPGSSWSALSSPLWGQLQRQLQAPLEALAEHLWEPLWHALHQQHPGAEVGLLTNALWGSQDAAWVGWCTFLPRLGVRYTPASQALVDQWAQLARACGWWMPYERVCFVADRPVHQAVDAQGRLHAEDGPALAFADGFRVWAWHGAYVPLQSSSGAGDDEHLLQGERML